MVMGYLQFAILIMGPVTIVVCCLPNISFIESLGLLPAPLLPLATLTVPQSLLLLDPCPAFMPSAIVLCLDFSMPIFAEMSGVRSIGSAFTVGGLPCAVAYMSEASNPAAIPQPVFFIEHLRKLRDCG